MPPNMIKIVCIFVNFFQKFGFHLKIEKQTENKTKTDAEC